MSRRRVLAVRLDSAGDVLLTGPAIRAIASSARVTLLCGPRGRAAAELLAGPEEILEFEACWIDPEPKPLDPGTTMALVETVRSRSFDEAIIFSSFHQSPLPAALLLRLAGVPVVAAICEDYPGSLLDVRHRVDDNLHEVERALSLAATLGYSLPSGDFGDMRIRPVTGANPVPWPEYVVVHPGASVPARAWAPELHAELVRKLVRRGHNVVVTGGPEETGLTAQVCGPPDEAVVDLGGKLSFGRLARVLEGAGVVVVGNTGPAHLAAAAGTPVVSLFAPTVPAARWRPWAVPQVLLGDQQIPCAGCRARRCPYPGHPCLTAVRPDEVVAAVTELLSRNRGSGRRAAEAEVPA